MFVIGGFESVRSMIPVSSLPFVEALLAVLGAYFHVSTANRLGARN